MPTCIVITYLVEDMLMVLKGELEEIMVCIAPQIYCKHITIDKKGTPVLYVKLQYESESVVLQEA